MEKDEPLPKCFENRVSIKGATLHAAEVYCRSANKNLPDGEEPLVLILLTNCGIVCGTPASEEEYLEKDVVSEVGKNQYKTNLFSIWHARNIMLNTRQEKEPNQKAVDSGAYVCLKNVTAFCNGSANKFQELIIFADQVSGVSVGRNSCD